MKKRIILTSALAIALCLCLIAGSTFALFTSSFKVDVSVTAGYIDLTAEIDDELIVWSRLETEEDSDGKNFENGGTAELVDGALVISRMTPGDNVKATIHVTNNSDIAVKYRVVLTAANADTNVDLVNALDGTVSIADELGEYADYPMQGSTTAWYDLAAKTDVKDLAVTLSLPDTVGNEMMGASAALYITIEAVQWDGIAWDGTADTSWYDADPTATTFEIANAEELAGLAQIVNSGVDNFHGDTITLTDDINLDGSNWTPIGYAGTTGTPAPKRFQGTFDGAGYTVSNMTVNVGKGAGLFGWAFAEGTGATIKNVTVDNADVTGLSYAAGIVGHLYGSVENCKVTNSTIACIDVNDEDGDKAGAIVGYVSPETIVSVSNNTAENVSITANRDAGIIAGFAKPSTKLTMSGNAWTNVTVTWNNEGTGANIAENEVGRTQ